MNAFLPLLAFLAATLGGGPGTELAESAHYRFGGAAPWRWVRPVETAGYRVALASPDGATLEARVEVDASPLVDDAPFPPPLASLPAEARAALARPPDPLADVVARELTAGSRTTLEAIERVVAYTARRVRYVLPEHEPESAGEALRSRRGSCVGRSLVAADLLARVGIPARQVTGLLVAASAEELTPESRPAFRAEIGGVRHRWIEAWVPGLGWIPSDPGGLANTVTARHLALSAQPAEPFRVATRARTAEPRRVIVRGGEGEALVLARARTHAATALARTSHGDGGAVTR